MCEFHVFVYLCLSRYVVYICVVELISVLQFIDQSSITVRIDGVPKLNKTIVM